jgi:flagellar hook-associated protein 3 FlgL
MIASFTSTQYLNEANRNTVLKLQNRLITAQQELASGRLADVGASLGGRTSETVSLRQQYARVTTLVETNSTVTTRLDVTQTTLESFTDTAQEFISTLLASRDTENGPTVSQGDAQANLVALMDGLNSTLGGQYLFGGINTDTQPITNYYATPTPANRQAVINAFTTAFGTPPSDPANNGITAAAMQTFLDGPFANLFEEPSWSADWSSASDENLQSRISTFDQIETSTNATEDGYRKLAKAYAMVADLGVGTLNKDAFGALVDTAVRIAGEAIQDIVQVQAKLGTAAARVASANERMSSQLNIMNTQIDNLELVDPFEASTRVTSLLTQLETAYSLTARVQRLTILNYL